MTTEVQKTIARQFVAIAPRTLGDRVRFPRAIALADGLAVRFQYHARRKRRGAALVDMTVITVAYDAAADLYDVEFGQLDGVSLAYTVAREPVRGVDADYFARLA